MFFVKDKLKLLIGISADFAEAVLFVEPLGRNLEDGGVQMQGLIAESAGTGFELIQNELAVAAPLIIRMDSHAFDLGALWTCALQSTQRHKHATAFTNQKFSPILEIYFLDSVDIIIPGAAPQVGSGLLNGMHMQICDSFSIGRLITAQGEHYMVIVTYIWQKLSSVERDVTLIVTDFRQLLSHIFGETLLIVTHIWRNRTCSPHFYSFVFWSTRARKREIEKMWVLIASPHESGQCPFSTKYLQSEKKNCLC